MTKTKDLKEAPRRVPRVQETSPILYKLNCRITSTVCRREMLNRYLVTHFIFSFEIGKIIF